MARPRSSDAKLVEHAKRLAAQAQSAEDLRCDELDRAEEVWFGTDDAVIEHEATFAPCVRIGPRPGTSGGLVGHGPLWDRGGYPAHRGVYFPLLLRQRVALGVSRVGRHRAPTVTCQQSIDDRMRDGTPQLLGQSRPQRRDDQHAPIRRRLRPGLEELALLLDAHRCPPTTTP